MAAQVRRFEDHSDRWKREQSKQGVDASRWNAWRNLSPASRRNTSPSAYGKGEGVREQVRETLRRDVSGKLHARATETSYRPVDRRLFDKRTGNLSTKQLRKMSGMSKAQMDRDAKRWNAKGTKDNPSPYWYHS